MLYSEQCLWQTIKSKSVVMAWHIVLPSLPLATYSKDLVIFHLPSYCKIASFFLHNVKLFNGECSCDGECMRSFHATKADGKDSDCFSLGLTRKEVDVW